VSCTPFLVINLNSLTYLDIHTHRRALQDGVCVNSLSVDEILQEKNFDFASAGIHPWWLEDYTNEEIEGLKIKIEGLARSGKLWGIGETGIDRAYPEFLEHQRKLFDWHFQLAEELNLPLIIHSVRAGSDFLQILKDHPSKVPWIFHDFRGNENLMRDLLRLNPMTFFSFGISLDNSPQIRELLPLIPLQNLFLETDEQKHLDIHDIFLRAAEVLKMDVEFLKSQVWMNFKKIGKFTGPVGSRPS
jgi:TatD DNase family protein